MKVVAKEIIIRDQQQFHDINDMYEDIDRYMSVRPNIAINKYDKKSFLQVLTVLSIISVMFSKRTSMV